MSRQPLVFDCEGAQLVGMLHSSGAACECGAVIVVGGPQYRVGSHRHFLELADSLADSGVATLRFDYRGMGDSDGDYRGFEYVDQDIRAAIDELCRRTDVAKVYLIGLCDAASAIMMYAHGDRRVAGVVLLNPWVRSEQSLAQATVKHYYLRRLFSRDLWRKVLARDFRWRESAASLFALLRSLLPGRAAAGNGDARPPFQTRMLTGLRDYAGRVMLITSGDDMTAAEFLALVDGSREWRDVLGRDGVSRHHLAAATHTFSSANWRRQVNDWICEWAGPT